MTFNGLMAWWEKPRRRCSKIAHETHAFYDGDEGISVAGMAEIGRSFTIRHYTTDIVRIHPECVELLSVFPVAGHARPHQQSFAETVARVE